MIDAIGGEAGCQKLSAAFYGRVAGDPELRPLFPGKSMRCATEELSSFLIQFLGGDEDQAQDRWWLSLRESHARFSISEAQRRAWLKQMKATLESSEFDDEVQTAFLQFFAVISKQVLGDESGEVREPELAARWSRARAMDGLVADLVAGRDAEVLGRYREFAMQPSLYVGVLARMLQARRTALVQAVVETIEQDHSLADHRYAGKSLLHYAASTGHSGIVKLLLDMGVDANVPDGGSHPPLYRLANECSGETGPEIVRILVQAGAKVNYNGGATRATPLHMAARRGFVGIAQALLDCGADLYARDTKGCTPLDRAIRCRKAEVAQFLRKRMAV